MFAAQALLADAPSIDQPVLDRDEVTFKLISWLTTHS